MKKGLSVRAKARPVTEGVARAGSAWLWAGPATGAQRRFPTASQALHQALGVHSDCGKPGSAFTEFTLWGLTHH